MCEANAYLFKDGKEELFMEKVDEVLPHEKGLLLEDIYSLWQPRPKTEYPMSLPLLSAK